MKNNTTKIVLGVLSAILLIAAIALTVLLINSRKQNEEMQELFAIEREELESEYSTFATQYDELKIRITNDSLQAKLEQEKLRTQQLLEELKQTKASDAAEITRLKKELKTVRAVMRGYVLQIDSLNRVNEQLAKENKRVKARYQEASKKITNLSEEKEALTQKVNLASQLDAIGISLKATKSNGSSESKLKRAKKLVVKFLIAKNITTNTGEKTVYVRIMVPDGNVLTKNEGDTFKYENRDINYSMKKYIEYTGEEQELTMYWDIEEFLQAGKYRVHIFTDGNMIGYNDFELE
ncbi:MAG: hypothetical protein IKV17_05780 [Bacteroidaceae bacterium]|nr:hypothetical protein [Bacteroidaceae bacterium]